MKSTERLTIGSATGSSQLQSKLEIADRGTVRLGDSCITAVFPPLRQPKPDTADRGTVRLGDSCITAVFRPRR